MRYIQVWGHSSPAKKIYNMQQKIVRIINNKSYRSHTDPLFKKCQLLKLEDLYTIQVALFMHDYKYDDYPHHLLIYSKKAHSSMVDMQTIFQDIDQEHAN